MNIALFGNPNTGKSSIFNMLTGLRQHVGNFPGVTVDKKAGSLAIAGQEHQVVDFPGCYSVYPHSEDEGVVYNVLSDPEHKDFPDLALIVVDAGNLRRNLLLFSQIRDLGIPCVLILNMWDTLAEKQKQISIPALSEAFDGVPVIPFNARKGTERQKLQELLAELIQEGIAQTQYQSQALIDLEDIEAQEADAQDRYTKIQAVLKGVETQSSQGQSRKLSKVDRILTHKVWGYAIFLAILTVIFQCIFSFASYPMDLIDGWFGAFSAYLSRTLPPGIFTDLISQGVVPGLGGVVIFIPQIALLFLFISILEETGYMSRVVFIMDRLMRPFGLSGKSVVPLISSVACAIPGIMATRTINDWKDRIVTIMVAPLMSCSARIPVYTLLIALVIPEKTVLGFLNLQGLVLLGLYLLGAVSALVVSVILKRLLKRKNRGFLIMEIPQLKAPLWRNVGLTVYEKSKIFVLDAGKVILAISIILWALASYGPSNRMIRAEKEVQEEYSALDDEALERKINSARLQNSYIGILGKGLEPVIAPLGYDWKIGISLICSFAAREVFVGSLATIYSVDDDGEAQRSLQEKMRAEVGNDGKPVYSLATGLSLMVFYAFAMQCMATLAVVKRETKSWFWPFVQLVYMGILAYSSALFTYNIIA